jgi:4-amino-4-deoxy-L-arabinose transferase-like glycosyltransferase
MSAEPNLQTETDQPDWPRAVAVFIAAGIIAWLLWANRFFLSLDEGIYLSGAERILRGQVPYRDFFVMTGPGTFWIQAAILGLLGPTLRAARLALVFDLALLTALVYWLTARITSRKFALILTIFFFALQTRPLFRLYVNHRWDSSAFALLATALVLAGTEHPRPILFFSAGLVAATAAWITPSVLVVLMLLGLWLLMVQDLRRQIVPYLAGAACLSLAAGGVLLFQGAIGPMFGDLWWTAAHYPAANRVPYGYGAIAPGGLRLMFAGVSGAALIARATGLAAVLLPPVLPLAVYAAWIVRRLSHRKMDQREKLATLLMLASFGFVISAFPRWSADQLLFIVPIFYVLAGYMLNEALKSKTLRLAAGVFFLLIAVAAFGYSFLTVRSEPLIETRIGRVRAAPDDQSIIRLATQRINPGDTLFVYPYLPILYFLTGAQNPTQYSFLQPGMMDPITYDKALAQLRAHPPRWILYFAIPLSTYHGIWPAADPAALDLTAVDHFVLTNYHPVGVLRTPATRFFLLEWGNH